MDSLSVLRLGAEYQPASLPRRGADRKSAKPRPRLSGLGARVAVSEVASGRQNLSLGIGMGYVLPEFAEPGTVVEVEARGKRSPAVIVAKPVYCRTAPE